MLFYAAAGPHHQKFIEAHTAATYELSGSGLGRKVRDFIDTNEGNFKYLALVETLRSDSHKIQHREQLERRIGPSTITAETIRQILQWMDECLEHHDTCKQYQNLAGDENGLPLRLIDVDPKGEYLSGDLWKVNINLLSCEKATRTCIKHSQEIASTSLNGVRYLTLSHRWGDTAPTELTWDNLDEFSKQIPISNLSNTFKDTIHITRCLGFRYLWIDSICINQADPVERASEISRMQSIYRYSQLNLSATSGETGLIFQRNPMSVLPILRKKDTAKPWYSKAAAEEYLMISAGPWETFVDLGPLNNRAWVLQERLLAPRVLHCCHNMVYWECPCLRASEVDPLGETDYDKVTNMVDYRTNIKSEFVTASMNPDTVQGHNTPSSMDYFDLFHLIVRAYYSPKELTYSRDRLPAISGIARWFMVRRGLPPESYLAGLWRETLPEGLLWHFFKPPENESIRDLAAAPSWSWASVFANDNIDIGSWKMSDSRPLFQDLQTIIVPSNGDRFAQLEVATLKLQVSVIPIEREWRNGAPHIRLSGESKWYKESHDPWSVKPTTFEEKLRSSIPRLSHRLGLMSFDQFIASYEKTTTRSYAEVRWDTTDMLWADEASYRPRQLYMVPIAWDRGKGSLRNMENWNLVIKGLILHRLPGKGQYGRVGMFMTASYDYQQNPELAKGILRRIPMQALVKFSDGAISKQSRNGRRLKPHLVADVSQPSTREEGSRMAANLIGPEDHLGINDDGLSSIEIL
ncbi:hypothetical protein EsH8_II_000716 [Colletotrichum jinshuiense]